MASYRRHDSRRHGFRGWPSLPSGPPRSRRQQRPTRPRPRRRSTGERNAADESRQRTQRRRERRRSRRYHRRLRRRRRRSLVLLRARHGRLRDWQPRGRTRRVTTADRAFKSARESATPCWRGMASEFRRRSTTLPARTKKNDDEHQQRPQEAAAPRARRSPELSDDETRKRRRGPTQDRGRRTFGSRQLECLQSAMSAFHFEPPEAAAEGESRRRPRSDDGSSWETGSSFDDRGKRRAHGSKAAARSAFKTSCQRQR